VLVKLHIDGQEYSYHDDNQFGSQVLLPLIEKALKEHNLVYGDIQEIKVATGPGTVAAS
jgi:tRNA A37 threonylcarbamoyladenosine modification protein TsaB